VVVPDAFAQAPAAPTPTFKITGLIDSVGTYARNMSASDINVARNNDAQFYNRTRGVFTFIGEYGKSKGVLSLEMDHYWGQTGSQDSNNVNCIAGANNATVGCATQGSGAEASFDLNTDTQGNMQIKWLYTEFELPLIPVPTVVRLGGQPFASAATYKGGQYASGDFGGVNIVSTITPNLKLVFTYVAVEELLTGKKDIGPVNTVVQSRGDDLAFIIAPEITPIKGLDIKPMYSYFYANGVTSGAARTPRGGYSGANGGPFAPATISGADSTGTGVGENRHTIGLDARFRSGPFSLDPTVLYQFGNRTSYNTVSSAYGILCNTTGTAALNCAKDKADISAWLVDIRPAVQIGPVLLEGVIMWTSGNRAEDTLRNDVNFFQPLDTDTGYLNGWGTQITSLGIDYYQSLVTGPTFIGNAIGYDKYGRMQVGARATYALTPTLSFYGVGAQIWTHRKVDTDSVSSTGAGYLPSFVDRKTGRSARPEGDSRTIGTEFNAGLTWRFAPGLVLDLQTGYLFAGAALGHRHPAAVYCEAGKSNAANCQPPDQKDQKANDVYITSARIRFTW
jgi:hypothetical protein